MILLWENMFRWIFQINVNIANRKLFLKICNFIKQDKIINSNKIH